MTRLKEMFEELGFTEVATFIASGNILFTSAIPDPAALETMLTRELEQKLGFGALDPAVRTRAEIAEIAARSLFRSGGAAPDSATIYVSFFPKPLSAAVARQVEACATEVDAFEVHGRELFWLCRIRSSDSTVWKSVGIKSLRLPPATMRNLNTIQRLAALYPPPAG